MSHYNTRFWEDCLAKHHRGGGQGPERRTRDENWAVFDRNQEEDQTIRRHLPALAAALADLRADEAIRAARDRTRAPYAAHLVRLARAA